MPFDLDEDQRELKRTIRELLDRVATSDVVRTAAEREHGFARPAWKRLVGEMELTGLAIAPEYGGAGTSFVEVGVALEELGRTLLPVPFLPTVVAAAALAGSSDQSVAGPLLERITAGEIATIALHGQEPEVGVEGDHLAVRGTITHVLDGAHAAVLVLAAQLDGEPALLVVDLKGRGVEVRAEVTMDLTRRQATVTLEGCRAQPLNVGPGAEVATDRARAVLAVAHALEAVGAAGRCLELTVAYLGDRVQFGRPIGSFQALKHRCADLYVVLEAARSAAEYAAWVVNGAPQDLPLLGPLAQLACLDAFLQISAEAIQLHGGIAFTWEHDIHLYFKRAKSTELLSGGRHTLRRLVGERAGIV